MTLVYWASWDELLQVHRREIVDQIGNRSFHDTWFSFRYWRKVNGVWYWKTMENKV